MASNHTTPEQAADWVLAHKDEVWQLDPRLHPSIHLDGLVIVGSAAWLGSYGHIVTVAPCPVSWGTNWAGLQNRYRYTAGHRLNILPSRMSLAEAVTDDRLMTSAPWSLVLSTAQTTPLQASHYPHQCPRCGAAAYVGAAPQDVDCSAGCMR